MFRSLLMLAAFFGLMAATPAFAASTADQEIDQLLSYVKALEGASFVRNGSEHSPAQAEQHLRMKWEKQRGKISSAEKFIELCATRSSMSGTDYQIRFADGKTEPAAAVLSKELKRLRSLSSAAKPDQS